MFRLLLTIEDTWEHDLQIAIVRSRGPEHRIDFPGRLYAKLLCGLVSRCSGIGGHIQGVQLYNGQVGLRIAGPQSGRLARP